MPVTRSLDSPIARSLFKPAREFFADAAAATTTAGALPDAWPYYRLDDAASQGIFGLIVPPPDLKPGTSIAIRTVWVPNTTMTGAVRWSVNALIIQNGTIATATGTTTAVTGTSSAKTAAAKYEDSLGTIFTNVQLTDILRLDIRRLGADGADTMNSDQIRMMGLWLDYTAVR